MKKFILILSTLFCSFLLLYSVEVVIPATDDCVVSSAQSVSNLNSDSLTVMFDLAGPTTLASFIQADFSAIPAYATITSAVLSLNALSDAGTEDTVTVGRVIDSWSESSITYSNMPGVSASPAYVSFTVSGPGATGCDITDFVAAWHTNDYDNYGIALMTSSTTTQVSFSNSEAGSGPSITVNYSLPDIYINNIDLSSVSLCAGQSFLATCDQNISNGNSTFVYPNVGYFLSEDATCLVSDIILKGTANSALNASNPSETHEDSLTIPSETEPGDYYICFFADYQGEVDESDENNSSQKLPVTINDLPDSAGGISGLTSACLTAVETYSVTNVPGVTYSWTVAGGTYVQSGNSIDVTWNLVGANEITVTPSNACGDGPTNTINVDIIDVPAQPDAISGETVPLENTAYTYEVTEVTGADSYSWNASAGTVIGSTNSVSVTWTSYSSQSLTVAAVNTCGTGSTTTLYVDVQEIPESINENSAMSNIQLYPNPANATLFISNLITNTSIEICSLTGRRILILDNQTGEVEINFAHFNPGIYMIKFTNSKGTYICNIIKQ